MYIFTNYYKLTEKLDRDEKGEDKLRKKTEKQKIKASGQHGKSKYAHMTIDIAMAMRTTTIVTINANGRTIE